MIQYATNTAEVVDPFLLKLLNPIPAPDKTPSTNEYSESEAPNAQLRPIRATKPITSLHPACGPRPTVQSLEPDWSMQPTTPTPSVGSMASFDDSMLASSSQAMKCQFTSINEVIRKSGPKQHPQVPSYPSLPTPEPSPYQPAPRFNVSGAEASHEHQVPESSRLQSMGSQLAICAARDSPILRSTAARSHSQPSMASPEAHIHPPPATTPSLHTAQWSQELPAHLQGMQPYPGAPPSENAAPFRNGNVHLGDIRDSLLEINERKSFLTLPGSNQVISVPVDCSLGSKKMDEKRGRGALASTKYRKKKKAKLEENLKELKNLREEKKEWEEKMEELHEEKKKWEQDRKELEEDRDFYRNIVKQTPSLSRFDRPLKALSQTSNTAATNNQGSPDERQSKRRRTNEISGLSTPAYGAFVNPPTGVGSELPPKQNLQDTPTRWVMPQSAGYRPQQPWW